LGGGFVPVRRKIPWQYVSITRVILLAQTKIHFPKTAKHPCRRNFGWIFSAKDDALLTQGKDDNEAVHKKDAADIPVLDAEQY